MRAAPLFVGIIAAASLAAAARSASASVVVFPLDPRGVAVDTAAAGTKTIVATLNRIPGLDVIEPKSVEAQIGVNLTQQARKCEYDVFCLVEVGEILQGDHVLIGHLRQKEEGGARMLELKLIVLDVAKASITNVLIWSFSADDPGMLDDAAQAATRRLFAAPDVRVEWRVEPAGARITLFGDPYVRPKPGEAVPFWSGAYAARFEAEGYHPLEKRVVIPGRSRGGTVTVDIEMEQDPLYVKTRSSAPDVNPFDKSSRREGTGISAQDVAAVSTDEGEPSPFLNPFAWGVVAVGALVAVVGGVVMSGAQSRYDELAGQSRFTPGVTVVAEVAVRQRDEDRSTYRNGSLLMGGGVLVALGGAVWMIVDSALGSDDPPPTSRMSSIDDGSADRAAASMVRSLYGAAR